MQIVTTGRKPKPFAWSYSKLKNYETCPKRSWHIDHAKDVKEEESEQLRYGNMLHDALAKAISGKEELPQHFKSFQPWVDKVTSGGYDKLLVENKLALTKDFGPCSFFDNAAWYRGVADVIKTSGPVAAVIDWKTGKIKEDGVQLALMAACVFAHHPEIEKIRTEFVWLKEDGAVTRADFARDDMPKIWNGVLPRVQQLEEAVKTTNFPPKPGNLCKRWCPVEQCPHWGE